jgi:hypothetical protein
MVCVPYFTVYHKTFKKHLGIVGLYNATRHGQYFFQKLCSGLDTTADEVKAQITSFVAIAEKISDAFTIAIRDHYKLLIHDFYEKCCEFLHFKKRPEVTCYKNAMPYAGQDIKLFFVLKHAFLEVKRAFGASYLYYREYLLECIYNGTPQYANN